MGPAAFTVAQARTGLLDDASRPGRRVAAGGGRRAAPTETRRWPAFRSGHLLAGRSLPHGGAGRQPSARSHRQEILRTGALTSDARSGRARRRAQLCALRRGPPEPPSQTPDVVPAHGEARGPHPEGCGDPGRLTAGSRLGRPHAFITVTELSHEVTWSAGRALGPGAPPRGELGKSTRSAAPDRAVGVRQRRASRGSGRHRGCCDGQAGGEHERDGDDGETTGAGHEGSSLMTQAQTRLSQKMLPFGLVPCQHEGRTGDDGGVDRRGTTAGRIAAAVRTRP